MKTLGTASLTTEIPAQRAVAAVISRDEISDALQSEERPELQLDVARRVEGEPEEQSTISITWSRDDLERLLQEATGDRVVLTFDGEELSKALADVEAHGFRERALVFAVAAAGALGSGAAIANAMPAPADGAPAPQAPVALVSDAASGGGYATPAATTDSSALVSDASSGGGYVTSAAADAAAKAAHGKAVESLVTDASSGGGYVAPAAPSSEAMVTDASSGSGYVAPATSDSASMVTDASSGSGYTAPAEPGTGGGGGVLDIHAPSTGEAFAIGGILLTIAGAGFASRRMGSARPA